MTLPAAIRESAPNRVMITRNSSPEKPQDIAAPNQESPSAHFRFTTKDGRHHGFPISQMLYFVLEPNEPPSNGGGAPPQRLRLEFPSKDVTITGYRLHLLCDRLDQRRALRLRADDSRFANLHATEPFVAEIFITPAKSETI